MPSKKPVHRESAGKPRDLSAILQNAPPGAWVALSHDKARIAGTGASMTAAANQAQLNGEPNPIMIKMPLESEGVAAEVTIRGVR
jgi:hypothetical protein